jgi:formamidopyrimidine-DNA glycosylase
MPELPEVEVSRLGITPHLLDQRIEKIVVRQRQLRWPIPTEIDSTVGLKITSVTRRAKYLLLETQVGAIILHLGMSGKLRVVPSNTPVVKHDHLDICVENGSCLRLNDPRRFGACLWQATGDKASVLAHLGPEPLTEEFDGERLFQLSRGKTQAVKNFIMDNKTVVGVGNIYASESLYLAGVSPLRSAKTISKKRYVTLAEKIKIVLERAIKQGGTTLKDFAQVDGQPGYFAQELFVYGRKNELCKSCESDIKSVVIGQRNSFYCPKCQT